MRRVLGVLLAPRLIPLHVLGLVVVSVFVYLGVWQFEARQAEREAAVRDLSELAPVPLADALAPDDPFPSAAVGRPVEVTGSWLPDATFFVSDRELDGRDGSWVVTPVAVCDDPTACSESPALLVVRGWTDAPADAPPAPKGQVDLTGWLQPPEGSGRPDPDPTDDTVPELRVADALQRVDQDLYGAYLVTDEATPADATRGLQPVTPDSLPEPESDSGLRNLLYGVQWWVFALFALYVWWRWAKDELERAQALRAGAPADEPAPSPEVRSRP